MPDTKKTRSTTNVRGKADQETHKALRTRMLKMEKPGEPKPILQDAVTVALKEWAAQQVE